MNVSLPFPPSLNRLRAAVRGRLITTKEGREYKRVCQLAAAGSKPLSGPVEAHLTLHPRRNKDGSASKVRPDLDNVCKVAIDSLSGLFWEDDRQIEVLTVRVGEPVVAGGLTVTVERCDD